METKFTKGKWQIAKNTDGKTCIWVGASRIAIIDEFPHEGSTYNAKLIACAPQLLAMLEIATDLLRDHATYIYDNEVISLCKDALSKATT